MLRERLKQMDLKVTELADYLRISRPTLYSYIELYDNKRYAQINGKVLQLFNYVTENSLAGKRNVINYILNNLVEVSELETVAGRDKFGKIKKTILDNPDSKKSKLISYIAESDTFDETVFYLADVFEILKKKKRTKRDERLIKPYENLLKELENLKNSEG